MERTFKGVWIADEILFDNRLTPTEKIILAQLEELKQDPYEECGPVYLPSNEECSEYLNVSKPTFTRALRKFKKLGMIKIYYFDGRTRFVR